MGLETDFFRVENFKCDNNIGTDMFHCRCEGFIRFALYLHQQLFHLMTSHF